PTMEASDPNLRAARSALSASTQPEGRGGEFGSSLEQRAESWDDVVKTLDKYLPGWDQSDSNESFCESALRTIRALATPPDRAAASAEGALTREQIREVASEVITAHGLHLVAELSK